MELVNEDNAASSKKMKQKDKKVVKRGKLEENETRVQSTNDDSIVSKRSSSRAGYFEDDFLVLVDANQQPFPCSTLSDIKHL